MRIASPAAVTALRLRRCGALVVVRCSSARASCPRTSCLCLQFPLQLVQVRRPVVAVAWTLVAPDPCVRAVRLERPPHPPHLSPLAMAAELRDKILDALLVEVAHELPDGCGRDRDGGRLHLPLQSVQRAVQREKVQKEANQAPLLRHLCPLLGRIATERTPTSVAMLSITRTRGLPAFRAARVFTASPRSNAASLRLPCGWVLQLSLPVYAPGGRGCRDGFWVPPGVIPAERE